MNHPCSNGCIAKPKSKLSGKIFVIWYQLQYERLVSSYNVIWIFTWDIIWIY